MIDLNNETIYANVKEQALQDFGVVKTEDFDVKKAIRQRIDFLKNYVKSNNLRAIILGISGGVDSTSAGKLSCLAMQELTDEGYEAKFVAVRLPAHTQRDEEDAQIALDFIKPHASHTINIGAAADILSTEGIESFEDNGEQFTPFQKDFNKGNMKARLRMTSQYYLAPFYKGIVIGTDHNAEGILSFYTKFGDSGCDILVLNGLNKRQVRLVAKDLGAPDKLWNKAPTADLEELNEHLLDEDSTGIPYDVLDDFLEGKEIDKDLERKILDFHMAMAHKRAEPVHFK
jgi:NAD+ synthase